MKRTGMQGNGRSLGGALALLAFLAIPLAYFWLNPLPFSESGFASTVAGLGASGPLVVIAAQVAASVFSPIPNSIITVAAGMAYGGFLGGAYSFVGGLIGAASTFQIERMLGRDFVHRFVRANDLESVDGFLSRHGVWAIFLGRLVPFLSFDAVSYAAGLTQMDFWGFMAASFFGSAPAVFAYAYLGDYSRWIDQNLLFGVVAVSAILFFLTSMLAAKKALPIRRSRK